jgi:DNA segregation ATPase FtsK/SpoIIIE, S-DNA-T family
VTEDEIAKISAHWARQGEPEFDPALMEAREEPEDEREGDLSPDNDDLLEQAAGIVVQSQTASVSMLQRRLRVGYTRAGRLVDMLERRGIISGYEGSKPRQVLVTEGELSRVLSRHGGGGAGDAAENAQEPPEDAPEQDERESVSSPLD